MADPKSSRIAVRKTYKLAIGGEFPRTESGRTLAVKLADGRVVQVSRASRKDLRNSVEAARKAAPGWAAKTAYNRGQVLYRIAEILESRGAEMAARLVECRGVSADAARREVEASVDRLVHFAGWSDKIAALLGTVNPVAAPYFSFSQPEAMGVVGLVAPDAPPLLGLVSRLAPVLVSGNVAIAVVSRACPIPALDLAEILATSDVPGGVVNLLSGQLDELVTQMAGHRNIDAVDDASGDPAIRKTIEFESAINLKRTVSLPALTEEQWFDEERHHRLAAIEKFVETKTTWHPVGV